MLRRASSAGSLPSPPVPHQLRHGGPSADAVDGFSMKYIQVCGRWKHWSSCTRYMKHGRYLRRLSALSKDHFCTARRA
eukprot:4474597-Heterocapsa_arctica.AAC.1